ncbi:hypothetical protein PVAP13_3KG520100 [Panicum virgatum]|uniref:Uncharacterized protein n=1 Tax=Panicum virgatum TaxID=38727 RepID=A0A8T0VDW4_PANVG|nr:hypothetical protein PVAP13_3KG520100 [Panicum virgatum]
MSIYLDSSVTRPSLLKLNDLQGQWRNPVTASAKLPFGRQVLSQQQKIVRMEQFRSKRSYTDDAGPERLPWSILAVLCAIAVGATIPNNNILKRIKESRRVDG